MSEARETDSPHECTYRDRLVFSDWRRDGTLRERVARRVPVCEACGRHRPARRARRLVRREREAASAELPPARDEAGARLAARLARKARRREGATFPVRGILGALGRAGFPASLLEERLEGFLRAGWVRLGYRITPGLEELREARVIDPAALEEHAAPGERRRREEALESARELLAPADHPVAAEVARLLETEAGLTADLVEALAAVALHAAGGEILDVRVLSARALGDSKALGRVRGALERLLGPLAALGIREGGAVTWIGGRGCLEVAGASLDLETLHPYVALSRQTLGEMAGLEAPEGGLLVVENFAAFEACCRGEVRELEDALVVWSAGYPGRGVRALVEAAAGTEAPVTCWADIDLDGVRIARLVEGWAGGDCAIWNMDPSAVEAASARRPLTPRARAAIEADLASRPGALAADTLRDLLDRNEWVEQEVFLAR